MTAGPVRPALTSAEWAALQADPRCADYAHLWMDEGWRTPQDRHALAALALHGHPAGFTAADVRLLHDIERHGPFWPWRAAALQALAARIAALLPPDAVDAVPTRCEWLHPQEGQCWLPAAHDGEHAHADPGGQPWSQSR